LSGRLLVIQGAMARGQKKLRSRPHVVVLLEPTHPSGRDVLRGVFRYAEDHGGWSLHYATQALRARPGEWLWTCDGVIGRNVSSRIVRAVRRRGIPMVCMDYGTRPCRERPRVVPCDREIGRKAAAFFLQRGACDFAFLGRKRRQWSQLRLAGFKDEAGRHGHTVSAMDIMPFESEDAPMPWTLHKRLGAWAAGLPRSCAIFCANDEIGFHLAEACRLKGLRLPEDLSLLGVDNDELFCELCNPPMSSIVPNHLETGWRAAACLDRLMRGKLPDHALECVPPGEIVIRRSTDRLAVGDANIVTAVRFLEEHACQAIDVDAVAGVAGLSRSVLQRRFKAAFGQTVHARIIQERLQQACRLLVRTARPIAEIAEETGFAHQSYMGAMFRKHLNMSPAQYRRKNPVP
jgi:LacI family transcriptional regulator